MIKKTVVLLLFLGLTNQLCSQEIQITYTANDKPLSQVFRDLERDYDVYFAFSPAQIKGKKASIQAANKDLTDFLAELLRPLKLVHELIEKKFISVKTPESVYLRAQVFDGETGETLPFATARLKDSYLGGVSDADGRFKLFIDEPLDATLEFSFLGYDPQDLDLNSYESGRELKITLQPEATTLQQVVIKEYVNSGIASDEKASSFKILPQEMEVLPGLSERDVLLSAQIIAGINSNDETASGLNIRGSSRDNTFIYWNDIPMYQSAHYFGNISSFIPASIGEVNIYKNYVPVKYGGSSAGLLSMESRMKLDSASEFEGSINMTHADVYAKLPFKGDYGGIMIAARRSYNDLFATPTFKAISDKLFEGTLTQDIQQNPDSKPFSYNSHINFSDLNLSWHYEPDTRNTWKFSFLRSGSVLDYSSTFDTDNIVQTHDISNLGMNLKWEHRISEDFATQLSTSFTNFSLDYRLFNERTEDDLEDDDILIRNNTLRNFEIRSTNDWKIDNRRFLRFGYQLNHYDVVNNTQQISLFEEDDEEALEAVGFVHALFGEYNWDITDRLELILGARLNQYGPLEDISLDHQVRLNYQLTDHLVFKSAYGQYNQFLSAVKESDFNFSNTIEQQWVLADDDDFIPLITNKQLSLGFLYNKNGWLVDLDLYRKVTDGLISLNLGFTHGEGGGFDAGSEELNGLDLTVLKRWSNFRVWSSYNFQDSEVYMPELTDIVFPSSLNTKHQLQVSSSYTSGAFEFSLGYTFKTGLPWTLETDPQLVTRIIELEEEEEEEETTETITFYESTYGPLNGQRLRNYHRVDASVWYKFGAKINRKWSGEIGLSLINLLNHSNVNNRTFEKIEIVEDAAPILESRDRILLGFTPNLSIRIRF
ncbi:MAG: TonB-dependent receptor [Roseivirga sp.]|nr:TonB-dependent receptor [Roseivirga sp.]